MVIKVQSVNEFKKYVLFLNFPKYVYNFAPPNTISALNA